MQRHEKHLFSQSDRCKAEVQEGAGRRFFYNLFIYFSFVFIGRRAHRGDRQVQQQLLIKHPKIFTELVESTTRWTYPDLIFVIFSPLIQFSGNKFSTQKCVNHDKTDFATKVRKLQKTDFMTK